MPSEPAPAGRDEFVGSDEDVDLVIELCGGDAREAVRTLIVAYAALEEELGLARRDAARQTARHVSRGYVRGRIDAG